MNAKKGMLILICAVVILFGWISAIRAVTQSDELKEQKELQQQADAYMERGLYVRAIPLYEQAVESDTKLTTGIEEKLLAAYLAYGDMSDYAALAEKRAAAGTALEEEYLTTAQYYVAKNELSEAIAFLRDGIAKLDSDTLREYLEENRYGYVCRITEYQEILPSATNSLMAAYNGEKWGYIDDSGAKSLEFVYDTATGFGTGNFAVVSQDGTYYSIQKNGDKYGADDGTYYDKLTDVIMVSGSRILGERDGAYSYFDVDFAACSEELQYTDMTGNACGVAAVKQGEKWGVISDSGEEVLDFTLDEVAVNSLGCAFAGNRAMVREGDTWYMIDTEGNRVGDGTWADAKAPESSGYIAVANADGKWGFVDANGESVIECQYNDAYSFSQHLAAVKVVDDWVYISEGNAVVIDLPLESALPFHNGIAQAKMVEGTALITLKFSED